MAFLSEAAVELALLEQLRGLGYSIEREEDIGPDGHRPERDSHEEVVLKQRFEDEAKPFNEQIEALSKGVQTWCEAHRAELTKEGKVKFHGFAAGEVKWRMRPPRVSIRAVENVLETLKRLGLSRFIRVKEEPNKEAMLAEPEAVTGLAGVKIEQGEDFVIVPFETELEEVA